VTATHGNHRTAMHIILRSGPAAVAEALALARDYLRATAADEDMQARLSIIVEELVINLVEHGGAPEGDPIELRLEREADEGVRMTLIDGGTPFDPREATLSEVPPERGGGAGIALVLAWAEIVDYASAEGRNRLELVIKAEC
jgi:serine/threonine-protein kinase RsbW